MARFAGKVVLISGGARGQGAAEARAFAAEGASVVFGDLLDDAGKVVESEINAGGGGRAMYRHLDVTDEADWAGAVAEAVAQFGGLHVLVNNAGIVIPRVPIEERTVEEWDRVLNVNAKGVFLGTKHAIPEMRRVGGGSIINIASVAGLAQSSHQEPAYAASKGAVRIFSKVTASQHAKDNIRCNAIFPGPIDTDMLHNAMPDPEVLKARVARVPLGRMGSVPEIVNAVLFLASDESSYTSGAELLIDGAALSS
ncbi:MAG: glucose 1-dehydrogenase [Pseudomonadota bacterium]